MTIFWVFYCSINQKKNGGGMDWVGWKEGGGMGMEVGRETMAEL